MAEQRDWRVYFAFINQLAVTLGTFILAILLLANRTDIELHELRFGLGGRSSFEKMWVPLLAIGWFLQAGFSSGASVVVWLMKSWAVAIYAIALGLGALLLAMTVLLTTYIGWVAGFFLVLHVVGIPAALFTTVQHRFQPPSTS